jgi:hypothetical protein
MMSIDELSACPDGKAIDAFFFPFICMTISFLGRSFIPHDRWALSDVKTPQALFVPCSSVLVIVVFEFRSDPSVDVGYPGLLDSELPFCP